MCGILVYIKPPKNLDYLRSEVKNRGPDHFGETSRDGIVFESSVLSLRLPFTSQPVADEDGVLCYNGQIYARDSMNRTIQDTMLFRKVLSNSVSSVYGLEGEFAFVYLDRKAQTLYFGRDSRGRRSLCYQYDVNAGQLVICSMGGAGFVECDGGGVVYKYNLQTRALDRMQVELNYDFAVNRRTELTESSDKLVETLVGALRRAVNRRCERPPSEGIALLFSGGLDCTILAALLDQCMEPGVPIELINVSFENRRTNSLYDTPDRILAHKSLATLQKRSPGRFTLTEIDVPYEHVQASKSHVQELMLPTATVMDLSIALAFYFATKPTSKNTANTDRHPRILFSGLGADELFAGYSRHTTAAAAGDPGRLADELTLDFLRLPHRNLGRDDRVVASWGRELRYPFLDDEVVKMAMNLPLNMKTDGATTKKILRLVAESLELGSVSLEKKRAIQFGARSAKMDPGSGAAKGHQSLKQ